MSVEVELAQAQFLQSGGVLQRALASKYKSGELVSPGEYVPEDHPYPRVVRMNPRMETIEHVTEDIKGRVLKTTSEKEVYDEIIVNSEEEEDRVLSGGKTSVQLEEDRKELVLRCRNLGIKVDPSWTAVRLRRELGDKMDAPEPKDELGELKAKLDALTKMAQMKAQIASLEAQLAKPADDAEQLRADLVAAGITPDKRWGAARLREELDRVTTPETAV